MWLVHEVTLFCTERGVFSALISAFCSSCLRERGKPTLVEKTLNNEPHFVHEWVNPCGHQDTPESICMEVASQCARPRCVVMFSESSYPYCTDECAAAAATDQIFFGAADLTEG